MKRYSFILLLLFQNCVVAQLGNPSWTLFGNRGEQGIDHSSKEINPRWREGQSCSTSYFGLIAIGEASADLAALRGRIKIVESIRHSWKTQYFFFQEFCTIVKGT